MLPNYLHRPLSCVVLFDIDGTLVNGPKRLASPGVIAMDDSAHALTGKKQLHRTVGFAGRTDLEIARLLLQAGGVEHPSDQQIFSLLDRYITKLEQQVLARPYEAIAGGREAVLSVKRAGAVVGLGTGNLRRGARAKLRSARLDDLFDLSFGGFGDDGTLRADILRAGRVRCDPDEELPVIVIGDTPRDVVGAHQAGMKCVAVATGHYGLDKLTASGADLVLERIDSSLARKLETALARWTQDRERED